MSSALYSVGTWDTDLQAFTPQLGLAEPSINVALWQVRAVLRELREMGYSCHRVRDGDEHDSDPYVLVERTDGRDLAAILRGWER